jgi:hypothetical protein
MANHVFKTLIPVLILAGAAAAWTAPRKPFSHKYHLKQVTSCENCHKEAAASTKAEDNLLPDHMACVTCHDEVEIGEPNNSGVDKFNHAIHVEMGNIAALISAAVKSKSYLGPDPPAVEALAKIQDPCSACHRGIPQSDDVPHGKKTAAHFPHMADCLVCHAEIKPPDSCKKCHVETTPNFRPANHTAEFSDKHGDKDFPREGCAVCHGRKFTCKGCH